jgi:hypothetical protein
MDRGPGGDGLLRNELAAAEPDAHWASWQRARQASVLSPNDVRREEGWPASSDPTADSIEPPVAGGKAINDSGVDCLRRSGAEAFEREVPLVWLRLFQTAR